MLCRRLILRRIVQACSQPKLTGTSATTKQRARKHQPATAKQQQQSLARPPPKAAAAVSSKADPNTAAPAAGAGGQPHKRRHDRKGAAANAAGPGHQQLLYARDCRDKLVHAPFAGQTGPLKFEGELRYAWSPDRAARWLQQLLQLADTSSSPVAVGFDTETAASWTAQGPQPTSLMQLCYHPPSSRQPICLLLALSHLGFTEQVCQVLCHTNIIKVGIGMAHDVFDLQRSFKTAAALEPQGLLDLSWLANKCQLHKPLSPEAEARVQELEAAGIKTFNLPLSWGLAGLLEHTTEFTLSKPRRITMSNWAKQPLSPQQLEYAAGDAYAGLAIYHSLWLLWLQQQQEEEEQQQQQHASAVEAQGQQQQQQQQQQQPEQQQPSLQFTLQARYLTSTAFWSRYGPAVALHRQWTKEVLQPGFRACRLQLERTHGNAREKAEAADASDWQLGGQHDSDSVAAKAGWGEAG